MSEDNDDRPFLDDLPTDPAFWVAAITIIISLWLLLATV